MVKPIRFSSSCGELAVNRDGYVIKDESSLSDYLEDIVNVNLPEMYAYLKKVGVDRKDYNGNFDILNVGFWTTDGEYSEPTHNWRQELYEEPLN